MMKIFQIVAACLFVVSLPLLLLTSNLRFMVGETYLYQYGFDKYEVSSVTGLEENELIKAATGLIRYFKGEKDSPQVKVIKNTRGIELFSQREIKHLKDVKGLIQLFYAVQWITLGYILAYTIVGFIVRKQAFLKRLALTVLLGGTLVLTLFAFLGIWAVVDFQGLFLKFHLASFQNELWMLDPSKHYLIMMFPEGFFHDAALFLVGITVAEAIVLGGVAGAYLKTNLRNQGGCAS